MLQIKHCINTHYIRAEKQSGITQFYSKHIAVMLNSETSSLHRHFYDYDQTVK